MTIPNIEEYQFYIDAVTPELIAGWVFLKHDLEHPVAIEVRHHDEVLWQSQANLHREDLTQAGFGDCAFVLQPDVLALPHDIDTVDIYFDGVKANEHPYPLVMRALDIQHYVCHVDAVHNGKVVGWAHYPPLNDHRVDVALEVNGVIIGKGKAQQFRADLKDADIGDGHYAFEIPLDLAQFPAASFSASLILDGKLSALPAVEISVAAEDIEKAKFFAEFADEIGRFEEILAAESQRISQQIAEYTPETKEATLNTVVNVAIQNLAELAARFTVLERIVMQKLK